VWLRPRALLELARVYGTLPTDAAWTVITVDGGYEGRDGLHLEGPDGRRIAAWRSQVRALPRCEYCGLEGHTSSKGNARTCPVRAAEVQDLRARQSLIMREIWRKKRAAAAAKAGVTTTLAPEPPDDRDPPRVAA
jgi:hypothetical protein